MLSSFFLVAWLCEAWGGPVNTQKASDIEYDEGYINSLNYGHPRLKRSSETTLDLGDYVVREGDILLPSDRSAVSSLWPEKDGHLSVPYNIDPDLKDKTKDILKAFNMISSKTCISFHERTDETDYLHFQSGNGCGSFVGCLGGEQMVVIGEQCRPGNICHEILHSLGLMHEHSRLDRNDYITVNFNNILAGKEDNFIKRKGNTLGLDYDLGSILHYGNNFFSSNGKATIVPKESGVKIGQRTHMSDLDIERIRRLYHCDASENKDEETCASEKNLADVNQEDK